MWQAIKSFFGARSGAHMPTKQPPKTGPDFEAPTRPMSANEWRAAQREANAALANRVGTPPEGIPADPDQLIVFLAGELTDRQVVALRKMAALYALALAQLRVTAPLSPEYAKGEAVLAAMNAALDRYAHVVAPDPFRVA